MFGNRHQFDVRKTERAHVLRKFNRSGSIVDEATIGAAPP